MSPRFKKFLIGCAIAFPILIAFNLITSRLPKVACIWEENGQVKEGKGKVCDDAPDGAIVFRVED